MRNYMSILGLSYKCRVGSDVHVSASGSWLTVADSKKDCDLILLETSLSDSNAEEGMSREFIVA
jgi:hypothetical protein